MHDTIKRCRTFILQYILYLYQTFCSPDLAVLLVHISKKRKLALVEISELIQVFYFIRKFCKKISSKIGPFVLFPIGGLSAHLKLIQEAHNSF